MTINEATRQRLLAIRSEFRRRLDHVDGRPLRNKAVFYSGAGSAVPAFRDWLAARNPAFADAKNLEDLPAGRYLDGLRDELIRLFGSKDFDTVRSFPLAGGAHFSGSINGMWRELSARYAKACSGVVHVLVTKELAHLHRASIAFWADSGRRYGLPKELKVLGFVELPILLGMLSENRGVSAVNIYVEDGAGSFRLLPDGRFVIAARVGWA